jgi:hypothetical protein
MYDKVKTDKNIVSYIDTDNSSVSGNNCSDISTYCKNIRNFMDSHFDMEKCKNIDNLNYDENFIIEGVSSKLDKIIYNYENSFIELKTIQVYFDKLIAFSEKESKSEKKYEYVKIHDTEKMGYTLISTKRRGKLLEEQIKKQSKIIVFIHS